MGEIKREVGDKYKTERNRGRACWVIKDRMSECWGKIERKRGANREVEDCGRSENMRGVTQFDCGGSHRPREECVCAIHW